MTRRTASSGRKLASLVGVSALVLVTAGSSADTFAVTKLSETNSTITLGWSPQPGYGYLFSAGGVLVSRTNDPNRSSVKFSKVPAGYYDVDVITKGANGHYPGVTPPPPAAQCADGADNDGDGKVDYPADPGCSSATDNDETDPSPPPSGGYPDASNTGVPSGVTLTAYTGPGSVTTSGTVIDSKTITCIDIDASNVTIRNSRIVCFNDFWAVQVRSGSVLIEDSEISCAGTNNNGIGSTGVTLRRVDISGCENGLNVAGTTTVEDSYIHDLVTANGAHTDGAQFNQGAANIVFRHNTINPTSQSSGATSCIIMWDEGNPQNSNVLIENNRLLGRGTAATIYTPRQGPLTNVRVINNRMIPGQTYNLYNGGNGTLLTDGSGNVNDATGLPISLD